MVYASVFLLPWLLEKDATEEVGEHLILAQGRIIDKNGGPAQNLNSLYKKCIHSLCKK